MLDKALWVQRRGDMSTDNHGVLRGVSSGVSEAMGRVREVGEAAQR